MAHDLQISRTCYNNSRNVGNLIDLLFLLNLRDAVRRHHTFPLDGARLTITSVIFFSFILFPLLCGVDVRGCIAELLNSARNGVQSILVLVKA